MVIKTILFLDVFASCAAGAIAEPMLGVLGYMGYYCTGPESQWWAEPIREQGFRGDPVVIEDDVWIAGGAIILPGSHIGRGAVIAAGSVVRGYIAPGVVAAGSPAVPKRQRGETEAATTP